jgi:hypothetical protein
MSTLFKTVPVHNRISTLLVGNGMRTVLVNNGMRTVLDDNSIRTCGLSDPRGGGLGGRRSARGTSRVGRGFVSCLSGARSRRRRQLSTLWSRSTLTPPTKGAASLGAAEMWQALVLRSAEANLAVTH